MRLLVTGGQGFLGSRIANYYKEGYEVLALPHQELDITDKNAVNEKIKAFAPELVIHCAAISDTGYAQEHPKESYAINVTGSEHIALACAQYGAKLIFMSSDQIYNGNTICADTFQAEKDEASEGENENPVSAYATQKLVAEQKCLQAAPDTVCLRLTWMFDRKRDGMKTNRNLLTALVQAAASHDTISYAKNEYRGITSVWEVVRNLKHTFGWQGGVYNFGSCGTCSSFELARIAEQRLGYSGIVLADTERFRDRPRNLAMCMKKAEKNGAKFLEFAEQIEGALR